MRQRRAALFATALAIVILSCFSAWMGILVGQIPMGEIVKERQLLFPNCAPCDIAPVISPWSTPRDLILTATTSRVGRLELLVRSLRSVGSIARIVVLVPRGLNIPDSLIGCGVEMVEMGTVSSRALRSPHKMRWEWYYRFLSEHSTEFDRIFHTDAFDAFFQGDPFAQSVLPTSLYLLGEGRYIGSCPVNSQWILKCAGAAGLTAVKRRQVLCSGSVFGSAELFLGFVNAMVNRSGWDDCWQKGHDQGVINHMVYTELFGKFTLQIWGCESGYLTMGSCSQVGFHFDSKKRVVTSLMRKPCIYIHQYNRYSAVDSEFQRKCGLRINRTAEKVGNAFIDPNTELPG
jgi:hypothetical protein